MNTQVGIIRGMHYQSGVHAEVKIVRCISGQIYDVVVDLRPESETYLQFFSVYLSELNGYSLYIPMGFAHGYQTISPHAAIHYMVSASYAPSSEAGVRYDDPSIGIHWPLSVSQVSEKDQAWPKLIV